MRRLQLTTTNTSTVCQAAAACLRDGGVVVAPTETVYGLMTAWDNQAGRQRIVELKRRPADKHLQMLTSDLDTACQFGVLPDRRITAIAETLWPGPLTLVCPAVPPYDTIGLRIPDHEFVLELLRFLGRPIAATSANLSGKPAATNAQEACRDLDGLPDLLIDGGETVGQDSTVASIVGDQLKILREGPISAADLLA